MAADKGSQVQGMGMGGSTGILHTVEVDPLVEKISQNVLFGHPVPLPYYIISHT